MPNDSLPMVLVVDDDAEVRCSLGLLLQSAGYDTQGFHSAEALLEAGPPTAQCLILDVRMPGGMDGVTLTETLRRRGCRTGIVVVSGHGDVPLAVRAMKAGAADFLEKPYDDARLLAAVETVVNGSNEPEPDDGNAAAARARIGLLSPREREVLDGLVDGKMNKMIAYDLGISTRTVEVHRAHVMEKLGARSLSEVVRLALAAKL